MVWQKIILTALIASAAITSIDAEPKGQPNSNMTFTGDVVLTKSGDDLDNYARLTVYVYLKNGGTKKPGLEALFVVPQ